MQNKHEKMKDIYEKTEKHETLKENDQTRKTRGTKKIKNLGK